MRILIISLVAFWASSAAAQGPRIQLLGDSLMATHALTGRAIPNWIGRALGEEIDNRAMSGAMMGGIRRQYSPGDLDWVVLNGGGNDLWLGCGCNGCDARMEKLISRNGASGQLPSLVSRIRRDGARVLYVGYLRSPGFNSPIEHCRDEGDELERRVAAMAKRMEGVWILSNANLVPSGDTSFHAFDRIHPSPKGAQVIGKRVASVIQQLDAR